MTPDQCREARGRLGWSRDRLAGHTNTSLTLIRVFETTGRLQGENSILGRDPNRLAALRGALEAAGVEFTNGGQPGVRLKGPI